MLTIVPMPVKRALPFVAKQHRHNRAPNGGLFAAGVEYYGKLVGVAIAGTPVARLLADGWTIEITRNCTDGTKNACTKLYGALCRAGKDLGYRKAITYTLASESGVSLRAAGFIPVADLKPRPGCSQGAKRQRDERKADLFGGEETRPTNAKIRWERIL